MPGTSGILSPFGKIDGLYFNDSREPDDFEFDFKQSLSKIMDEEGVEYVRVDLDNKDDYYKLLDELSEFNKSAITISGNPKENYTIIMENTDSSDDSDESDEEIEEGVVDEE